MNLKLLTVASYSSINDKDEEFSLTGVYILQHTATFFDGSLIKVKIVSWTADSVVDCTHLSLYLALLVLQVLQAHLVLLVLQDLLDLQVLLALLAPLVHLVYLGVLLVWLV